jgi:hypothetical protein
VRPFSGERAAAYDLLITDPVEPWVDAVHAELGCAHRHGASGRSGRRLGAAADLVRIEEEYELAGAEPTAWSFTMRTWTEEELREALRSRAEVRIGPGVVRRTPDRLVVVARVAALRGPLPRPASPHPSAR